MKRKKSGVHSHDEKCLREQAEIETGRYLSREAGDIVYQLTVMAGELRGLRDSQEVIKCTEKHDICNAFDHVLDALADLRQRFVETEDKDGG